MNQQEDDKWFKEYEAAVEQAGLDMAEEAARKERWRTQTSNKEDMLYYATFLKFNTLAKKAKISFGDRHYFGTSSSINGLQEGIRFCEGILNKATLK